MKRKVIYLYKETHLPAEGWLQGCFICDTITSKTEEFKPIIVNKKVKYDWLLRLTTASDWLGRQTRGKSTASKRANSGGYSVSVTWDSPWASPTGNCWKSSPGVDVSQNTCGCKAIWKPRRLHGARQAASMFR